MKLGFYARIAADNVKKNLRLYLPRILAEAGLLGCFYILVTLSMDARLKDALGGSYLPTFMLLGSIVLGILSLILILYVNSFLMKRRKSEYGLYNVLGLEKRHITRVLFCESLFAALLACVAGLGFGALFYKLSSLLICRLLQAEVIAGFYYLSAPTAAISAAVFLGMDLFAFFVNALSIRRMNPAELLAGRHTGEKEPPVKRVLLLVGVLALGAGYAIALLTESPLQAILWFFAAVLLVILGTYCLFVTGSTFVLKLLKKNGRYYYDKRHMPAVSGLLFRMKQNAVGLASIAILATGVLVMVSTTVSLYAGVQDTMAAHYPRELYVSAFLENEETGEISHVPFDALETAVRREAEARDLQIAETECERMLSVAYLRQGDALLMKTEILNGGYDVNTLTEAIFITEDTYLALRGDSEKTGPLGLKKDEIAFCRISTSLDALDYDPKTLTFNGHTYTVKQSLLYFPVSGDMRITTFNLVGIVVADDAVLEEIYRAQKAGYGEFASEYASRLGVSFADAEKASAVGKELDDAVTNALKAAHPGKLNVNLDTRWESLHNLLDMYGTFLFLGILLGFVCLFSTILIIYYKQISEGYEDRPRFQIMEKIGMEAREVKKTIGSQLILQFFLPLATAALHTAVAFPILLKLLKILMLTNASLFAVCTLVTLAVFAAVYTAVYLLTAKTYYRIVHE